MDVTVIGEVALTKRAPLLCCSYAGLTTTALSAGNQETAGYRYFTNTETGTKKHWSTV